MDLTFAGYRLSEVVGGPVDTSGVDHAGTDRPAVPPGCIRVHDAVGRGSGERVRVILLPPIDGGLVRRSLQRARTVEHPHLLPDVEVLEDGGRVAVVAPWTAGGTLDRLLRLRGRLAPGEALTVLRPLTGALTAIGDAGLSHGALLPELVWFDEDGRPRLAGLTAGLALAAAAGDEQIVPVGAPHLAPEVARGARPDIRADLFSLGSLALLAVSGRPAWPAESAAEVLVQSAAGLWPEPDPSVTTPELAVTITGLLAADPQLRPPAAVVQVELRSAGRPLPVDLSVLTAPDTTNRGDGPDAPAGEPTVGPAGDPVTGPGDGSAVEPAGDPVGGPEKHRPASDGDDRDSHTGTTTGTGRDRAGEVAGTGAGYGPPRSGKPGRRAPVATVASGRGRGDRPAATRVARRRRRVAGMPAAILGVAVLLAAALAVGAGLWWAGRDAPVTAVLAGSATGDPAAGSELNRVPDDQAPQLAAVTTVPDAAGPATDGAVAADAVATPITAAPTTAAPSVATTAPPAAPGQAVIDWLDVVRGLDQRRAEALRTADPAPLDLVYVPGPAQEADRALVADLQRRGLRVDGGTHLISAARITSPDASPSVAGDEITVEVEQSLPAYPVLDASGRQVGRTPAVGIATAVLVLRAVDAGFAIVSVRPA